MQFPGHETSDHWYRIPLSYMKFNNTEYMTGIRVKKYRYQAIKQKEQSKLKIQKT